MNFLCQIFFLNIFKIFYVGHRACNCLHVFFGKLKDIGKEVTVTYFYTYTYVLR